MLSLRIAARYLLSRKSHAAVNVISVISVAGVAVATAAIVVVLSVFNGFADLAASHLSLVDPDLMVTPAAGKTIAQADSLAASIEGIDGVTAAMPSLTERGLLVDDSRQVAVVFKGVTPRYSRIIDTGAIMAAGAFESDTTGYGEAPAQLAVGVSSRLGLRPGLSRPELYVPRRTGRINPANPAGAFRSQTLAVTGIVQIDQMEYDADHMLVPLADARAMLDYYDGEATAIEVAVADKADAGRVKHALQHTLGDGFVVADRVEQHAESYRMIAIEKWVTFVMLAFILVIAAFNIISTLSLMVIEKRDNMATLRFMGATRGMVRRVFMLQGAMITAAGGLAGCVLGLGLALAQQYGRFIRLGGDPSQMTIDVYPVRVEATDILAVMLIIAVVAAITSLVTRIFTRHI
ncbi:MAG: FtsX-like permease family protein [Bacteroidales bacterium]|nr:FtsX-like permease family protein [Bacteroidales bacterium]